MPTTTIQTKNTEKFKKSFGGTIKSIMNSGERTYFILEYKSNNLKHKVGEVTEFIGDYIELGRGNSYAVNFGDDCPTVSRPHAAIIRNDNTWSLKHLSQSNITLINNRIVNDQQLLNNGDEIQLSSSGPKMSFLVPANNRVKNMGMTIRMKALVNEAIKPYKKTISIISAIFLICLGGLFFYINHQSSHYNDVIASVKADAQKVEETYADSIQKVNARSSEFQKQLTAMSSSIKDMQHKAASAQTVSGEDVAPSTFQNNFPNVYYIVSDKVVIKTGGETKTIDYGISGTGFLLSNGDFVTARHVIEPWFFGETEADTVLNLLAGSGGEVEHFFTAYSPDGTKLTLKGSDFTIDRSSDQSTATTDADGNTYIFTKTSLRGGYDWAVYHTDMQKGLPFDKNLSANLPVSTTLYILGYPFGMGAENMHNITPMYSECKVSRNGLDDGVIDISGRAFDHGNSGGPVFVKNSQQQYVVVGIVSAEIAQQGVIVPINAIQ